MTDNPVQVTGLVAAALESLNVPYLRQFASSLGVTDLLERALKDAQG